MNLSAIHWVRMLVGGSLLLAWLPVITRPRGPWWPSVVISAVLLMVLAVYHRRARTNALALVRDYAFPAFLKQKLLRAHPQLSESAARDVERGLRQFFDASARAQGRFVAMPSRVVDTLWHEFILHTRGYEAFCRQAFGRMLHHTPAEALPAASNTRATTQREGLRRAWYWACRSEGIDPRKPSRLPLLFSLGMRKPATAEKCLAFAVTRSACMSIAVEAMSASAKRSPCDSAKRSINSAARSLMAGVRGTISVLRAASPFFSLASSALSRQPCANSM